MFRKRAVIREKPRTDGGTFFKGVLRPFLSCMGFDVSVKRSGMKSGQSFTISRKMTITDLCNSNAI
jgi:hypothetical protein